MEDLEFKTWLERNTNYNSRTIGNIVSRHKRAESILAYSDDCDSYLFSLSRKPDFNRLSPSVKSQIKKAVRLHCVCMDSLQKEIGDLQ